MFELLRIFNKTDGALSIQNFELPENSSIDIDIPYTSNLKMMEKCNVIAVVEIPNEEQVIEEVVTEESATEITEDVDTVEKEVKPRKKNRK